MYHYQVFPTAFPLLSHEEQMALIDGFKELLLGVTGELRISIQRRREKIVLEDRELWVTTYKFYASSTERLDELLERAGLRYRALAGEPPSLLDPSRCIVKPGKIVCDGRLYKVIAVYGLPSSLTDGWLYDVIKECDEVRLWIKAIPRHEAYGKLRFMYNVLLEIASEEELAGKTPSLDLQEEIERCGKLLAELARRESSALYVKLCSVVGADSPRELSQRYRAVKQALEGMGFKASSPLFAQWPCYELQEPKPLIVDSESLATFYPFISTSLYETEGVFLGRSLLDDSPVFLDLWSHKSYNVAILGMMGTGKSAVVKKLLYEYSRKLPEKQLYFLVLDRTGEYERLAKAVDAQVVVVKRGRELGFDPLKLMPREHAASFLSSLLGLDPSLRCELSVLVAKHESLQGVATNASGELRRRLQGLLEGTMGWVFRGSPPKLSNRVVVVMRDLGSVELEGLVGAAFLLTYMHLVRRAPREVRKIIVLDEFLPVIEAFKSYDVVSWMLMSFKDSRKLNASFIYVAHDPREVFSSSAGKIIAGQLSAIKMLFQHDYSAAEEAAKLFGLSPRQREAVMKADRGECLLLAEHVRLPVKVELSRKELELVETRPTALVALSSR